MSRCVFIVPVFEFDHLHFNAILFSLDDITSYIAQRHDASTSDREKLGWEKTLPIRR